MESVVIAQFDADSNEVEEVQIQVKYPWLAGWLAGWLASWLAGWLHRVLLENLLQQ